MKMIIALLLIAAPIYAKEKLTLTFGHPEDSKLFKLAIRYFEEINGRLDSTFSLDIIYLSQGRAAIELCKGTTDGDFARTDYVYKHCDNVIKVPVPILKDYNYAYCKKSFHKKVTKHPDKSTRYVTTLGNKIVQHWKEENNVPCYEALTFKKAIELIERGRGDCYLGSDVFESSGLFKKYGITRSRKALFTKNNYIFLNSKHEKYVGQLTKVLYDLNKENYMQRLLKGEIK